MAGSQGWAYIQASFPRKEGALGVNALRVDPKMPPTPGRAGHALLPADLGPGFRAGATRAALPRRREVG